LIRWKRKGWKMNQERNEELGATSNRAGQREPLAMGLHLLQLINLSLNRLTSENGVGK